MARTRSLLVLILATALGATGCVDDDVSAFVAGPIQPQSNMGGCTYDPGGMLQFDGVYDVALATQSYSLGLLVFNQLQMRGGSGRAEPNGLHITRAEVSLVGLDGAAIDTGGLPNPFSVPTTGYIPPATDAQTPGSGIVNVEVVPVSYRDSIAAAVPVGSSAPLVARIKLFGETNGTINVETGDYQWPIDLCGGCLAQCLRDPMESSEYSCRPGQDDVSLIAVGERPDLCP